MSRPVLIAGAGAVTSIGTNLPATVAAVRASVSGALSRARFPGIRDGRPLILARLPGSGPVVERMREMAVMAALEAIGSATPGAPLPVLLAVPLDRPGFGAADGPRLAGAMREGLNAPLDAERSAVLALGHAGGIAALKRAAALVRDRTAEAVLVVGVESQSMATLDWLDRERRLTADDVPAGLVPGEGAAAILLASEAWSAERDLRAEVELAGAAEGDEPRRWHADESESGGGLADAIDGACREAGAVADLTYADQNGEMWRAEEWAVAYLRTARHHADPLTLSHPSDCWGDLGAASGVALAALAARDLADGVLGAARGALVCCSADLAPYRGAAFLTRVGAGAASKET